MNRLQKIDQKITIDKVGAFLYYIYKLLKLFIFLLNVFVIYKYINHEPKFLILSFIFNLIYICLYFKRIWLILLCGIYFYFLTNNISQTIFIAFASGNTISYILDLIIFTIISFIMRIIDRISKR